MRPGQQNRRMRGRNNNNNNQNRKGPNPLTRSYESNGPDVKIRGSAQQIAEKYTALARDAQSSGDRVMAENYLQHAEHYNRIILAAQAQMPIQPVRETRDEFDDDTDDDRDETEASAAPQEQPRGEFRPQPPQPQHRAHGQSDNGMGPQPVIEGMPVEVALRQNYNGQNGQARAAENGQAGEPELRANGNGGAVANEASEPGEDGPRRPRRPRRGRGPRPEQDSPPQREEQNLANGQGEDFEAGASSGGVVE